MEIRPFKDEQIVTQSSNNKVIITTYRARYQSNASGRGHTVDIMLNMISSLSIKYRSKPWFLLLCIIGIAGALYFYENGSEEMVIASLAMGVLGLILYLLSRTHIVRIASCGGESIWFSTSGMARKNIIEFIEQTEWAMYNYNRKTAPKNLPE